MDTKAFKERMKSLKSYREQNPDKGYWEWKTQAMAGGGEVTETNDMTEEEIYDDLLIDPIRKINKMKYEMGLPSVSTKENPILYDISDPFLWEPNYRDLPESYKIAVTQVLLDLNTGMSIEDMYNSRKYDAAIRGRYFNYPYSGRVRENDSPTSDLSSILEDRMNRAMYSGKFLESPNMKYAIPYIKDKEIKIDGVGRTSSNALDSIAKYADITNLPLLKALGLAYQETGLGAYPGMNYINGDLEWNRILGNTSYFRNYGIIPAEYLVRDFTYNSKKDPVDRNIPPLQHAFEYFKSGKYNPGDPNHSEDVKKRGKKIMSSPQILEWLHKRNNKSQAMDDGGEVDGFFTPELIKELNTLLGRTPDGRPLEEGLIGVYPELMTITARPKDAVQVLNEATDAALAVKRFARKQNRRVKSLARTGMRGLRDVTKVATPYSWHNKIDKVFNDAWSVGNSPLMVRSYPMLVAGLNGK